MKRLYAPITKVEESDDGTIKVWGYASTGTADDEDETIQPEAIKAALPDYLKWGAVREMHQPKAIGTAIEATVQDDGKTWFGAHVVDPIAVKKVQTKVLKGFSVGGRITDRDELDKSIITGIKLIEVSLVDRPANPECEILIAKRSKEADVDDLSELLNKGKVDLSALLEAADDLAKAETEKPYGDVSYADPGYQSDKKKRYPIDTEAHIRAAWSYINKGKNQDKYTSKQVDQIKGRIVAAWKKKIDKDGPPASEKLAKGLYSVGQFAQCLEALAWVCQAAQADYDWEGDGSPVPEKMRAWMQTGADLFAEMADEEAKELVESLREQAGEAIELVMKGQDAMKLQISELEKAGARFSADTKKALGDHEEHLGKLHKAAKDLVGMCKEACDKAAGFGQHEDDSEEGKAAKAALLAAATDPTLAEADKAAAKAAADAVAAAEAAKAAATVKPEDQATELAKIISGAIEAAVEPIRKAMAELSKQPVGGLPFANEAAAAAALAAKGHQTVARTADVGTIDPNAPVITPVTINGKVDDDLTIMKAVLHPSRAQVDTARRR